MSIVVDRHADEEILDLNKHDKQHISTMIDCRDESVNLQSSLQEQGSPYEKTLNHPFGRHKVKPNGAVEGLGATNFTWTRTPATSTDNYDTVK